MRVRSGRSLMERIVLCVRRGGDAGLMLQVLQGVESLRGSPLTLEEITSLVRAYPSASGQHAVHIGTDAEVRGKEGEHGCCCRIVLANLVVSYAFRQAVAFIARALSFRSLDITQVPRALVEPALSALLASDGRGLGDPFLSSAWLDPERFHVRRGLLQDFLRAFHTLLWTTKDSVRGKDAYYAWRGTRRERSCSWNCHAGVAVAHQICGRRGTTGRGAHPRSSARAIEPGMSGPESGSVVAKSVARDRRVPNARRPS